MAGIHGIDAGEAPDTWQAWAAESVRIRDLGGDMGAVAEMNHVLKGLRMLEESPWVAGKALMLLTLNERPRHLEAPPADEGLVECIFKQLHAALEKLLLAPAEHTGHVGDRI